ncbi:MAG: hypothetical protein OXK78_01330 [Caldilineaceae bacterium]|nr:hypothetical protein [Caldilineaceae bacterium]
MQSSQWPECKSLTNLAKLRVSMSDLTVSASVEIHLLRAEDLTNAWAYYRSNRDEIEQQITENETA